MASYKKTITLGLDYSEFSGGIKECNNAMKDLDSEFKLASSQMELTGSKTEKLGLKQEYLTQKINVQQQKVEEAKKKYNALMDAHADTSKIEAADRALLKERTTLQNLQNEMDETNLSQSNLKENATALVAVVTTIGTALYSCADGVAQYADDILTASQQTGVATDTLQELSYAADLVDVDTDTMTSAMARLAKNMDDAADSSSTVGAVFKELGVNVKDSSGEFKSSEEVFYNVIDALGEIDNQTERDNLAMTVFGKSAQDLAGVIEAGSEGLAEYGEQAEELGIVMSEDDLEAAGQLQDAMDKMSASFDAVKNSLGLAILPVLTEVFNAISNIPVPVLAAVTTLVGLIATVVTLGKTISSVTKAAGTISDLMSKVSNVTMADTKLKIIGITVAIAAVVAIIAALIAEIIVLQGKSKQLQSSMEAISGSVTTTASNVRSAGHNASGTRSWRGGSTWVGENGPELIDLPAGTRIYNNRDSKAMAGNTYNVTMNCDLASMRSLGDVVEAVTGISDSVGVGVI